MHMGDKEYFSNLYEIARHLNKEFSLQAALRKALERTVDLLELETGWIWLVQSGNKSVYLAASYNLPPALANHPERLSGWCYCIQKYFSDNIASARNISEITCSRLKDIQSDTRDLKFHATVPISVQGEKAGLMNLVSKESQQLNDKQLSILNTISELMGIAIQRTRLQESFGGGPGGQKDAAREVLERILAPRLEALLANLGELKEQTAGAGMDEVGKKVQVSVDLAEEMRQQLSLIGGGLAERAEEEKTAGGYHYPTSPLTKRELEVLAHVRKGSTNKQIASDLFITERTVKFHISSILSKLYAETRTEAVDIALRRGLLGL